MNKFLLIWLFLVSSLSYGQTAAIRQHLGSNQDVCYRVNVGGTQTDSLCLDGPTANVGIGTNAPGSKLEVNGTTRSSSVNINGSSTSKLTVVQSGTAVSLNDNRGLSVYSDTDGTNNVILNGLASFSGSAFGIFTKRAASSAYEFMSFVAGDGSGFNVDGVFAVRGDGRVSSDAGIIFPLGGNVALSYHANDSTDGTVTGADAGSTVTYTIKCSRVGNSVNIGFQATGNAASFTKSGTGNMGLNNGFSSVCYPSVTTEMPIYIMNNGTKEVGIVHITSGGTLTIRRVNDGNWTNGGTAAIYSFGVSFSL